MRDAILVGGIREFDSALLIERVELGRGSLQLGLWELHHEFATDVERNALNRE
jgi:hypothetical protein